MMSLAMVNVADEYPIGSCSNVVFHLRTNVTSEENVFKYAVKYELMYSNFFTNNNKNICSNVVFHLRSNVNSEENAH